MDNETTLPAWIIFLLIALGVALAVGVALLLTQLDTLQQRTLLPQATLPVVDLEATVSAGELTVVVIAGEDSPGGTPTLTSTPMPQVAEEVTPEPTAAPVLVPTCAAAPEGWIPYSVQDGDSLATLSIELGVSIDLLLQANCLTQAQLLPGQIIFVPSLTPTKAAEELCGAPAGWVQYVVKPGDTLAGLAKRTDTAVVRLMQANCLQELQLVPGRKIFLPVMPDQKPEQPPGMPMPPAQHTPPRWPPGTRPTATFPAWPTKVVIPTPTKEPWPAATPTPSWTSTAIFLVTATPSNTATPSATSTPEPPPPSPTSEPPYPANVPSPTATATSTSTPIPTATNTPLPTATYTPSPTATNTPLPTATNTPIPTATATPEPPATSTATVTPLPYPYP